jgi:hypothetical protein
LPYSDTNRHTLRRKISLGLCTLTDRDYPVSYMDNLDSVMKNKAIRVKSEAFLSCTHGTVPVQGAENDPG